jgi:GntR family transcriptional repressor for pyruvate dehydrogenase complex
MTANWEGASAPSPLLRKVQPTKVSAEVARQIVELIRGRAFPVGARLPSEKELAERMGVSRPSVREALAALEAVGLVETQAGRGNFVRRFPSEEEGIEPLVLLESEEGCREIIDARGALEPPVAVLAASERTEDDLAALRAAHTEMIRYADALDFDPYFAYDKAFHQALVRATHNELIVKVLLPLVETMDQRIYREFTRNFYMKSPTMFHKVMEIHGEILAAVAARNAKLAEQKMRTHWQRMRRVYEA